MSLTLLSALKELVKTLVFLELFLLCRPASGARLDSHSPPKLVFAHFITGLTFNYSRSDWSSQCALAASHGIDAFALNVGSPDEWQLQQVKNAFEAADAVKTTTGTSFKLFLSLDMSVIQTAEDVTTWVTSFVPLSAQLRKFEPLPIHQFMNCELIISSGAWTSRRDGTRIERAAGSAQPTLNALFIPAWSGLDPNTAVSNNPVVDGIMTWNSWPSGSESTNTINDYEFQTNARASQKLYMAGVSPCFFTHYEDKNWIYRSDDNLYISRWMKLISMPNPPDFIQIISWNDYGESHYIGPKLGTPPTGTDSIINRGSRCRITTSNGTKLVFTSTTDLIHLRSPPATDQRVAFSGCYLRLHLLNLLVKGYPIAYQNWRYATLIHSLPHGMGTLGRVEVALLDSSGKELMKRHGEVPINNDIKRYNFNILSDYAAGILSKETSGADPALLPRAPILLSLFIYHALLYLHGSM
ncbi:hypothetical protein PSHT_13766 [Puccinia striiformis]|uniref:Glycoside hydrolase family 71 protein n=1 Tax=Puccinia striiformis TaxID=27350 RepID=A0A2S4UP10_9BASI|nr:hypothetical protein PSHT_13766 [Puccinia striiformis]